MRELKGLFVKEYETSNTNRFDEVEQPGTILVVRKLYVQKKALELIGNPDMVEVIIRPAVNR